MQVHLAKVRVPFNWSTLTTANLGFVSPTRWERTSSRTSHTQPPAPGLRQAVWRQTLRLCRKPIIAMDHSYYGTLLNAMVEYYSNSNVLDDYVDQTEGQVKACLTIWLLTVFFGFLFCILHTLLHILCTHSRAPDLSLCILWSAPTTTTALGDNIIILLTNRACRTRCVANYVYYKYTVYVSVCIHVSMWLVMPIRD